MFEIKLANGLSLKTANAEEIANFYDSNGESIAARPADKNRQPKKPGKKRIKK